jgi:OmpA-OmpF porin, OOP family
MSRKTKRVIMKRLFTLLLFTTLLSTAFTQNADLKWSIGLMGGKTVYNGDWGNGFLDFSPFYGLGSVSIDRYLSPSFDLGIQAEYGDYGFFDEGKTKFLSTKTDGFFLLKYKFNNGYIFNEDAVIGPYLCLGFGMATYSGSKTDDQGVDIVIPAGIGFKLNMLRWMALQYQFLYSFTNGDSRDLKKAEGNDGYASNTLGLIFSFGAPKDTDKDGVSDKYDKCPGTPPGVAVTPEGCPIDTDKDGIPDYLDKCPTAYGLAAFEGCPDTDGDGVPDNMDKCPNTPAGAKVSADGCPVDSDGDGVPDYLDKCPNTPQGMSVTADGCPADSDGDGVPDYLDKCPNTPKGAVVGPDGCPSDADGDGIPDYLDKCPNTPKGVMVSTDGCPVDTDGDGVPDYLDKCPTVAGIKENSGCPEIKAETKKVFDMALRGINFETGKAIIKGTSFQILNDIVLIMKENPEYNLEINGHTDSQGNDDMNMKLSQDRADAVKDYLTNKGIDSKRLTAKGFGESMPVADNDTSDGRALNRRVEFKVVF